jgi:hypothetical protein
MSKQSNKAIKRARRNSYIKRRKVADKTKKPAPAAAA